MTISPLDRFLSDACAEIERRSSIATQHRAALATGAKRFREALRCVSSSPSSGRDVSSQLRLPTVPVAEHMAALRPTARTTSALCASAANAAPELPWIATPRLADGGTSAGLSPLNDVRDFGEVICGLMLLAPNGAYPEHDHPPHEIYLPVAGDGRWRHGGGRHYETLGAEQLAYNHPNDRHGAKAGAEPLLALYVLWD